MANAAHDNNSVPTKLLTSNVDGATPVRLYVDPVTHGVAYDNNTTGSSLSSADARRDDNSTPVLIGVSSADGVTPTAVYGIPASGKLMANAS